MQARLASLERKRQVVPRYYPVQAPDPFLAREVFLLKAVLAEVVYAVAALQVARERQEGGDIIVMLRYLYGLQVHIPTPTEIFLRSSRQWRGFSGKWTAFPIRGWMTFGAG